MALVHVDANTLRAVGQKIAAEQESRQFRPTVVVILEALATRSLLMVETRTGKRTWGLPQGIVEPGEGFIDALLRELKSSLGVSADRLTVRKLCNTDQEPVSKWEREGYSHGKSLYYFHVTSDHLPPLELGEEVGPYARFKWVSHDEALAWTLSLRAKRDVWKKGSGVSVALQAALDA